MWEGILQACYLDERGNLLPRFNGIIYQWMYVNGSSMKTDAAASPEVVTRNGNQFRFRPKSMVGGIVAAEESLVPEPWKYEDMGVGGCRKLVLA